MGSDTSPRAARSRESKSTYFPDDATSRVLFLYFFIKKPKNWKMGVLPKNLNLGHLPRHHEHKKLRRLVPLFLTTMLGTNDNKTSVGGSYSCHNNNNTSSTKQSKDACFHPKVSLFFTYVHSSALFPFLVTRNLDFSSVMTMRKMTNPCALSATDYHSMWFCG